MITTFAGGTPALLNHAAAYLAVCIANFTNRLIDAPENITDRGV
jgi:hypothetical protein